MHVETVVLLSKLKSQHHIEVEITLDEVEVTSAESKATYGEIKRYIMEKYHTKVSTLYIAQTKREYGIIERKNYNVGKNEDAPVRVCPQEKKQMIVDAFRHFKMI